MKVNPLTPPKLHQTLYNISKIKKIINPFGITKAKIVLTHNMVNNLKTNFL